MLSLKVKKGSAVYLEVPGYPPIVVRVQSASGSQAQLSITADDSIYIRREELVPPDQRVPAAPSA